MLLHNAGSGEPEVYRLEGGRRHQGVRALNDSGKPLVSIVTVVLNGADHLAEAMESVFAQDYPYLEYIVIDGGSTDGTIDLIRHAEDQVDYWRSEPDRGLYEAMNKGIKLAQGDVIGLLNADDILYPDAVGKVIEYMGDHPEQKYTCGPVDLVGPSNTVYGRCAPLDELVRARRKFLEMPCPHLGVFVGRNLYYRFGFFDTNFGLSADYDFLLTLIDHDIRRVDLPFSVGQFRSGGRSGGMASRLENMRVLRKHRASEWTIRYVFMRSLFLSLVPRILPSGAVRFLKRYTVSKHTYY